MTDGSNKTGNRKFEKKQHRPWNSMLENTIQESQTSTAGVFDLDFDDGLDFNFIQNDVTNGKFSQFAAVASSFDSELDDAQYEIRNAIRQAQQQQVGITQQLQDKTAISLGGFFQPQQLSPQPESQSGKQINSLLSDLKRKKEQLSNLTTDLKVSEALERAEQAELAKKTEERGRIAAENRMRQAIEQAHVAAEQFHTAMEQANQAANAHREEEKLRKTAEQQSKEALLKAHNAEITLQNERLARIEAEEKAQQAIMDAEQAILYKQQLQYVTEQLRNLEQVKQEFDVLQERFNKNEAEYRGSNNKILDLEEAVRHLTTKLTASEQQVNELSIQREKLKGIIETEQGLRKIAEKKMQQALIRAEHIEKARQAIEQQMQIVDERAKRAIAHASRTVMQLLNAPLDDGETIAPKHKAKIKVQAFDADDDYSF